jgi:hypothetical protein
MLKHHATKTYGRVEVKLHTSLIAAASRWEWSDLLCGLFFLPITVSVMMKVRKK